MREQRQTFSFNPLKHNNPLNVHTRPVVLNLSSLKPTNILDDKSRPKFPKIFNKAHLVNKNVALKILDGTSFMTGKRDREN